MDPTKVDLTAIGACDCACAERAQLLRLLISAVVMEGEPCPWCALGFEPCICEAPWLATFDEVHEFVEAVPEI